jgi:hypothetical protein
MPAVSANVGDMLEYLKRYWAEVIREVWHWLGGAFVSLVGIAMSIYNFPVWIWAPLVVGGVGYVQFRAWLASEKRREQTEVEVTKLRERLAPKIQVFLEQRYNGVLGYTASGKVAVSSDEANKKWVQFTVACATDSTLVDCEVWLIRAERMSAGNATADLLEEKVRCDWSIEGGRQHTIRPMGERRVNLFSFKRDDSGPKPTIDPLKSTLLNEIRTPGKYRLNVLVTAKDCPSSLTSFIFEWHDFDNVKLTQEAA